MKFSVTSTYGKVLCPKYSDVTLKDVLLSLRHHLVPYVEVTENFILSETGAAQTYYLPSYALWNSWWNWPLYLGTAE
jgi:hypothetical protein